MIACRGCIRERIRQGVGNSSQANRISSHKNYLLLPTGYSALAIPYSLLPIPYSLFPASLRHYCASLDPCRDRRDIGVRDFALGWHWHGVVGGAFVANEFNQQ